jgi:hypothetical protein
MVRYADVWLGDEVLRVPTSFHTYLRAAGRAAFSLEHNHLLVAAFSLEHNHLDARTRWAHNDFARPHTTTSYMCPHTSVYLASSYSFICVVKLIYISVLVQRYNTRTLPNINPIYIYIYICIYVYIYIYIYIYIFIYICICI